jgi:hypothetical protein
MTTPAETVPMEVATAAKRQSSATHIQHGPDPLLVRDSSHAAEAELQDEC